MTYMKHFFSEVSSKLLNLIMKGITTMTMKINAFNIDLIVYNITKYRK